ncbi:siderophore-interacting protein [Bauldia sp.]|uniref:siderophore-interacting protein n=1 Tax=Bauldia sp. TaxID=2575872 RepID=UPI003BA8F03F
MNQTTASAPSRAKPPRRVPRLLTVKDARHITPNMIRVTFAGPELAGIAPGCDGAHCKILLPANGQSKDAFAAQLKDGKRPTTRTYTVRHFRETGPEMDVDFVAHGEEGPASAWALHARPGSFCGFAGPGSIKLTSFYADWYLLAADMSALPVAAATLEAMPRDAEGIAVIEVQSEADRQDIAAPKGIDIRWLIQPDPHVPSEAQERLIRSLDWPAGVVQTCIAGESGVIRSLRAFLHNERRLPKEDTYISGYWKIGLVEDERQKIKRAEAG